MQIDFHHAATYVIARLAGFSHRKADIVAYSAQYVDDAVNAGLVRFKNGAMYHRISSAHKMLDYRNFQELANHRVWIPFHFLPGNGGLPAGENPDGSFIDKLICRPDSHVARDMVRACIKDRDRAYGLHRLGITMHVYADTWAHQGFAGVNHDVNEAKDIIDARGKSAKKLKERVVNFFVGAFVSDALPLGHGAVLSYPDRPHLNWGYTNGRGEKVVRDNPSDFLQAADRMCQAMRRFQIRDPDAEVDGLPAVDTKVFNRLLRNIKGEGGEERHASWVEAIRQGEFSFGTTDINYVPKGPGSWKHRALGTTRSVDADYERFAYRKTFLRSHWKLFHDALQAHRFDVLHDILPAYGICAA